MLKGSGLRASVPPVTGCGCSKVDRDGFGGLRSPRPLLCLVVDCIPLVSGHRVISHSAEIIVIRTVNILACCGELSVRPLVFLSCIFRFVLLKLKIVHVQVYFITLVILTTPLHQFISSHVSADITLNDTYCTSAMTSKRELRKSWWLFKWINHYIKNEWIVIFSSFHYKVAYSDHPIYPFDGGLMASECGISACLHQRLCKIFYF